jgi:hypothetical protein
MEVGLITELITTLGFPIAVVIALGAFIWHIYKQSIVREDKLMMELAKSHLANEKAIETIALYAERLTHIEDSVLTIQTDVNVIKEKIQE